MDRNIVVEQLIRHEGLRLKPYRCPSGKLTIAVGRNLDDMGISEDEAMYMLKNDINRCEYELRANFRFYEELDDIRRGVLINMCFNLGISRLLKFRKMIQALENHNYKEAAIEMLDSRWAQQVKDRAHDLYFMMIGG